ncbi:hypothetical protein ACFXOD_11625 [Streptomyces sp. NPDC059161]|uniref:hypothetical protein n=1 Tax=Streptomyces sp. NPDC059161 TaxID=3346749 RepID=UPI00368782B1
MVARSDREEPIAVPIRFNYEQLLQADKLTTAELEYLIGREGRNSGPGHLASTYSDNKVTAQTATALIGHIWSNAEFPDRHLDRDTWRWLFKAAGFTVDGTPAERPAVPVRLWRGSVPERRTDWSWSTERAVAERYAFGNLNYRPPGRLYTVLAPPAALLCANTGRGEAEYVIDTDGLGIHEVPRLSPSCALQDGQL